MAVIDFLNRQIDSAPVEEIGIGGFTLLARVRETTNHTADAPVTYLEDGSHVEDHIILNPIELQIEGSVSDVHVKKSALADIVTRYLPAVGLISGYVPDRTASQIQRAVQIAVDASDKIREADRVLEDGKQILSLFNPTTSEKGLREQFLDSLDALYYGKQLVGIDMPFRRYDKMLITSRSIVRDNQQVALSFRISARQIRFAETVFNASSAIKSPSFGLNGQADSESSQGTQEGQAVDRSLVFGAYEGLKGIFGD
jgi:hypothetical protein